MKKSILIFCTVITTMSLMAFGFFNLNNSESDPIETMVSEEVAVNSPVIKTVESTIFSDFIYDVGPRFGPIKKDVIDKATSMNSFLSEEQIQRIMSYKSVEVIIIENDRETDKREFGTSEVLNEAQLRLLRSSNYSTNIKIRADYKHKNKKTGIIEDSYTTPHLTIVPEKQAVYAKGKDALVEYLRENSKESRVHVQADKLQPAKLLFTVTKTGSIENVRLDRTSNFPAVDKVMIELITKAPEKWLPAENSKGEKVDQELVVSFGLMGC